VRDIKLRIEHSVTRPEAFHAVFLTLAAAPAVAAAQGERPPVVLFDTMGSFQFVDSRGDPDRPITVWYYRPPGLQPDAPIVFVMHGSSRTAEAARGSGAAYGRSHRVLVLAPEFSERYYPGDAYAFGNMADSAGQLRPKSQWALSAIEHLFDAVCRAAGLTTLTYDIVGHSAGGQFVHRLVLFVPGARFRRAVASSPGRYAVPGPTAAFPYGVGGTAIDSAALAHALSRDFVLLLGDRDTEDRTREPEAMSQGRNRFARGLRFFAAATDAANQLGAPLGWRLVIVHGADHTPGPMVRAGLQELVR
jgi:poly(3-hydroxybutyrate) depolymerase